MFKDQELAIIEQALEIIRGKYSRQHDEPFTSVDITRTFVSLLVEGREREHFGVLYLDNRHRLIKDEILFSGSIKAATVHPREVVKSALSCNAAAVLLFHNHPSGDSTASQADRQITRQIFDALQVVDVRVLDHLIVGHNEILSFAEKRWL